jgi:hypothetical protein
VSIAQQLTPRRGSTARERSSKVLGEFGQWLKKFSDAMKEQIATQQNGSHCEGLSVCSSLKLRAGGGSHAIPHNCHLSVQKDERRCCHNGTALTILRSGRLSVRLQMSVRLHKSNGDQSRDDDIRDASSSDPRMLAGEAHIDDIAPDVTPNRRLRNWILLANAVAWVAIVVLLRWLFF